MPASNVNNVKLLNVLYQMLHKQQKCNRNMDEFIPVRGLKLIIFRYSIIKEISNRLERADISTADITHRLMLQCHVCFT